MLLHISSMMCSAISSLYCDSLQYRLMALVTSIFGPYRYTLAVACHSQASLNLHKLTLVYRVCSFSIASMVACLARYHFCKSNV